MWASGPPPSPPSPLPNPHPTPPPRDPTRPPAPHRAPPFPRSLSLLLRRVSEANAVAAASDLCSKAAGAKKEATRDMASIALKTVAQELPPGHRLAGPVAGAIVDGMLKGIEAGKVGARWFALGGQRGVACIARTRWGAGGGRASAGGSQRAPRVRAYAAPRHAVDAAAGALANQRALCAPPRARRTLPALPRTASTSCPRRPACLAATCTRSTRSC